MGKGRRIISAILLFAMIVTMLPATPITRAATEVSYVLDTDGVVDVGATYLIVRVSWMGSVVALDGGSTPGAGWTKGLQQSDQLSYIDGIESCEWTVEQYAGDAANGYSLLNKKTNQYLKLDANGIAHSGTKAPLSISASGTEYIVKNTVSGSQYYALYGFTSDFRCYSNQYNTLRFYKKMGGETPKNVVTVTTKLDDQNIDLSAILGGDPELHVSLDGSGHDHIPLTKTATGVYTVTVTENGTYSVYIMGQDGQHSDTGKDVVIAGANGALELDYYSVTYDPNGGALHGTVEKEIYPAGTKVIAQAEPTLDGYEFVAWQYLDHTRIHATDVVTESLDRAMILTAQWEKIEIDESLKTSYVIRYLLKGTYEQLEPDTTVTEAAATHIINAAYHAPNLNGYTYVGATIHGVFIEKEKDPQLVLDKDPSKNVLILIYTPDPDLHLHKEANLEDDGTYTIEMEMFTHNNPVTTLVEQDMPLDIVLVLDQSGSIETGGLTQDRDAAVKNFIDLVADHGRTHETDHRIAVVGYGSGATTVYSPSDSGIIAGSSNGTYNNGTATIYPQLQTFGTISRFSPNPKAYVNTGVFDSNGDFHMYNIKGFTYQEFTGKVEKTGTYYTWSHDEYLLLTYHEVYRHLITETDAYHQWLNGETIYGYVDGEFMALRRNESGLWVVDATTQLYSSVEFFTWHEDVWTHRHGIEGREIHAYGTGDDYTPTDGHDNLYTRKEATANYQKSIYRDALIPVTMGAQGSGYVDPSFDKIVEALGSNGQTRVSYGMEMAYEIFKANPLTEEDKEAGRKRIVIVFTDGKPGDSINFNEAETNAALAFAKDIKSTDEENGGMNAKIFAIGLYGDEASDAGADAERTKQDQKDFLEALSSNYPEAASLDDLWNTCDYVYVREGAMLPVPNDYIHVDGPYYVKVGEQYYPLQLKYPLETVTVDGLSYQRSNWYYVDQNGKEVVAFAYLTRTGVTAPSVGEDGVIVGEGGMTATLYRRIGKTYNQADSNLYHKTAENVSELETYFASVLQTLTTKISKEVAMTNDAILRDIMGQGLVLTPGTVITVYSEEGTFIAAEKRVQWSGTRNYLDSLTIPENASGELTSDYGIIVDGEKIPYITVYNIDAQNPTDPNGANYAPHTVDIVGYDYGSDEWYLNAESPNGKRLIVTITRVEAQDNVTWGRAQTTNYATSGLWLRNKNEGEERYLLEAFVQPTTAFVERAYVLDYGKAFDLSGWYFDSEGDKKAKPIHLDFDLTDGMNYFGVPVTENTAENNIQYGNVKITDDKVTYQPTTTQWGGYDQFYVFGNTWRNTIVTLPANTEGNLWNKVTVIPANNIYYEDSFMTPEDPDAAEGTNSISGFVFTGDWMVETESNANQNTEHPEQMENTNQGGGVHGWSDSLADDTQYSDGSAHVAFPNGYDKDTNNVAKVSFSFTGTGVDVYTRTNNASGMVAAVLTGKTAEGKTVAKSIIMDNLAVSGDYYQVPTISFTVPYGTYKVTLGATFVKDVGVEGERTLYYVDGIRVYNPLGTVSQESNSTVKDAYGKELNAVYTEIRDIAIANGDFAPGLNDAGVTGAVFIDWIREGQESGSDVAGEGAGTYEVATTFQTYGPKNEVYLAKDQAVVIKVNPKNTYYVGMKALNLGGEITAATVNVSGLSLEAFKTITIGHSTDLYYEVTPMDGYIVIENVSENGALLALTKLRTTNILEAPEGNGVKAVQAQEAVRTMTLFAKRLKETQTAQPEVPAAPEKPLSEVLLEKNQQLAAQLFAAVRTWLQGKKGGAV